MKVAILLTCFNRRQYTFRCLEQLNKQIVDDEDNSYKIYICDDGSTDGTTDLIQKTKWDVDIDITRSRGNLYWCKGMHTVMKKAVSEQPDFYLMINDDVDFYDDMLSTMFSSYYSHEQLCGMVGATIGNDSHLTYGGYEKDFDKVVVSPGRQTVCELANWNCFLIPKAVVDEIGLIDNRYAHAYGDFDYSKRMRKVGIPIFTADKVVGICDRNSVIGTSGDTSLSKTDRLKRLFSKKEKPFFSVIRYYFRNYSIHMVLVAMKQYYISILKILMN